MACQDTNNEENREQPALYDGYITLKMNENINILNGNNTIAVSLVDVSDKRCPRPSCYLCYGSKADILLAITNSKNAKVMINLDITGCIDEVVGDPINYPFGKGIDTLGYKFNLIKLSPYPGDDLSIDSINKNDYIAKIKISTL